jgi:hypothetical protein
MSCDRGGQTSQLFCYQFWALIFDISSPDLNVPYRYKNEQVQHSGSGLLSAISRSPLSLHVKYWGSIVTYIEKV